jgi:uncharacterized protein DUF6551
MTSFPGEAEGRRYTVETLPANVLEVDPHVQRKLNESRVARIAADFHEGALGAFIVSERTSSTADPGQKVRYVVLDGQTRLAALRKFTGTEETRMPVLCQVYRGLTVQEEAEIFILHNDRAAVRRIDLFRLALVAGHEWAVELNRVVARHGYEANDAASRDTRFTAITTAQRIIKLPDGMSALDQAFELIARSWGKRDGAASAEAVDGFGLLFHRHGSAVDVPMFAKKLASTETPQTFKANIMAYRAATGISRTEAAYRYTIKVYNSGKRTRQLEPRS